MTMPTFFASQKAPMQDPGVRSVWGKLVAVITEGPTPTAEDAIAVYLQRHQHDLPPGLWIELERRRLIA